MLDGSPLGSTPFGVGTPADSPTVPDRSDIGTGARFLTTGGQYEIDPVTFQLRTMPPVRQRFLLLVRTVRESIPSLPDFGISLPEKMDETFAGQVRNSVRAAARQMTDVERVARINSIVVTRTATGRASVLIAYTDLTKQVNEVVQDLL